MTVLTVIQCQEMSENGSIKFKVKHLTNFYL